MNEYRLGALLQLRRSRMEDARRALHVSVAAVREAVREHQKIAAEAERRRTRAIEPYPDGGCDPILRSAQAREQWRRRVKTVRQRLETQRDSLQLVEAQEREAMRALAEARAAQEALESHRRRWLEVRHAEQETAEEHEVDDWLTGNYSNSSKESLVNGLSRLHWRRSGLEPTLETVD